VKKPKDAAKQITRLKYQESSKEFDLTSVSPARIPTSHQLFTFNTKYRTLSVYTADGPSGFEVKGTSIKGFSESESFVLGLRKPKETLDVIVSSTPKQIEKHISTKLKTKKRKANGRINQQTIILRIIEKKQ
jgi:hypothetical protein